MSKIKSTEDDLGDESKFRAYRQGLEEYERGEALSASGNSLDASRAFVIAAFNLLLAARTGHVGAIVQLGVMYSERNTPGPLSEYEMQLSAIRWLAVGAALGSESALELLSIQLNGHTLEEIGFGDYTNAFLVALGDGFNIMIHDEHLAQFFTPNELALLAIIDAPDASAAINVIIEQGADDAGSAAAAATYNGITEDHAVPVASSSADATSHNSHLAGADHQGGDLDCA